MSENVIVTVSDDVVVTLDSAEATGPPGPLGPRAFSMAIFDSDSSVNVGNGKIGFCVPGFLAGSNITDVVASSEVAGITGTMDIQVRRRRGVTDTDVLTTKLTVDSGEVSSATAAVPHVVDTGNDDLAEGDLIYVDRDAVHTTPALGLTVTITAETP